MLTITTLFALLPLAVKGATYSKTESWYGSGFLDGFRAPYEAYDNTTNGDVFWAAADNTSLIYVNDADRVVMKVDNTSFVPYNEKRYSSKLYSKSMYDVGTVWVMDATHTPYGCSVWPALFTHGENWPVGGEIDIFESINLRTRNQYALHVQSQSCVAQSVNQLGNTTATTCGTTATDTTGCTVNSASDVSYGAGFAGGGGGVYVCEFASDGIRIWFFARSDVPVTVTRDASSIDLSLLGTSDAEYLSSGCDIDSAFTAQNLVIGTTLCGDWAGEGSILAETCPALVGDNTCYTTYVINDASATYANAYFELNYINVFSSSSSAGASASSTSSSAKASGTGATTTISTGPGSTTTAPVRAANGAGARVKSAGGLVVTAFVGSLLLL